MWARASRSTKNCDSPKNKLAGLVGPAHPCSTIFGVRFGSTAPAESQFQNQILNCETKTDVTISGTIT